MLAIYRHPPYTPPSTILCGPATMCCYPIYLGPYDYP